jgi:hypothetical protein
MKRSVMKNPSYYKTKNSGFFITIRMTSGLTLIQPIIETFNDRSNKLDNL